MKKDFLKKMMLALLLLVGSNVMQAQMIDMSGIDPENPASWFYVKLNASVSNPGCGTNNPGKVYLIYTDADAVHTPINPWITGKKPNNPYNQETQSDLYEKWQTHGFDNAVSDAKEGRDKSYPDYISSWDTDQQNATKTGYDAGWNWYTKGHLLNPSNPTGNPTDPTAWGSSASLKGYSVIFSPGFDDLMGYSAYAYFFGKVQENDGWYFTGWSFTEGESDLGGTVGTADSIQFRILPASLTGEANLRNEYVYATFQPIMVEDYRVNGLINTNISNSTTVVFDVIGQRISTEDFTASVVPATSGDAKANWNVEVTSYADNKITVTVTYSGTKSGEFRGNVKLASKSGCSELTAPVYVRVGDTSTAEATLYDGKTPTSTSGTLTAMIAAANNTDKIVVLNRNYNVALNVNAKVAINLNGYIIDNTLTVSGGELTLAYSKYGSGVTGNVNVNAGKLILNGTDFSAPVTVNSGATLEQNGATMGKLVTNNGTLIINDGEFQAGITSSGTLTMNGGTIKGATALTITNGTATINKGTIKGTKIGIETKGGSTIVTSKLAEIYGATNAVKQTAGTITLQNGKFDGATPLNGSVTLQAGFFKKEEIGITIPSGKEKLNVLAGTEYNAGYRYFIGTRAVAKASGVGVCRIGTTPYTTLEDALAYANNTNATVTIIMLNDYTLPAGYYTLPAKATLIVPMSNEQETGYANINRVSNNSASHTDYVQPTEFRRLTFANGVNMDVYGTIEITGTQRASDDAYAAMVHGSYGLLVMDEGSHMTLQNGSNLRAWGYMIGKGETDARRGSTVREQFQMGDWKGGSVSFSMLAAEDTRVFPITQYYIQNVESPVKYHPGAVLTTTTSVSANYGSIGMTAMANDIKVVGVSGAHTAMFLMDQEADAENTWVRKWYDAEHDVQTYEVNSGAHLGSMVLDLGKLGSEPLVMNSGYFVLPITNNMKIHLLSGAMDFTQTTSLLPGAEVEVDKEAVISIVENINPAVFSGSLYIYDADDWNYAGGKGDAAKTYYTKVVPYSPSFSGKPNKRSETAKPADAKINIHGSFDTTEGAVYTTPGGANIFSTNDDAGTFIFTNAAPTETSDVYQFVMSTKTSGSYAPPVAAVSAKLKNGNGTYRETAGTESNHIFMYMNDEWHTAPALFYFDCFAAEVDMDIYAAETMKKAQNELYGQPVDFDLGAAVTHIYIKPQEWVEIMGKAEIDFDWSTPPELDSDPYYPYLLGVTGNDDHTYSDADGAGRLFILMERGCQWWEVEKKDNLYHCIHPDNDTYYYWDDDEGEWMEKKFTITWRNWNGDIIKTADADGDLQESYEVTYGTMAEFLGTNPTREANIDYTYDFTGWSPALGPVTSDVTYTATYEQKERKYTIIFCREGGVEIERQFLTHNTVPVCQNTPTKVGYTLEWTPAISAVTGDATYTATWLENPPTEYEITFYDYNGTTVLQQSNVNVGVVPTPPSNPSGKPQTSEFRYVFDHWSPALEEVSATSIKSYTAVYREEERTYTISYYNEVGNSVITTESLPYGATPTPPAVTKENPAAGHTYTLVWKTLDGKNTIQTVMGNASYKPTYIDQLNKYTVTVKSNPSGACSITGAGLYDYNTSATITLSVNEGYTFNGWSDGQGGTNTTRTITVKEDKELVANFTVAVPDFTITWKNEAGTADLVAPVGQKANTATIYPGAIPTKEATAAKTYTFDGWTTKANGAGTFYKNGMTPKATKDATYYAHFKEEARKYNVFWKNETGTTTIEQDLNQAYGAKIAYNSATPTKPATAQYTYAFDGWATAVGGAVATVPATVSGDATFYAHFASTTKTYTITFLRDDGSLIDREEVAYGTVPTHATPTKPTTAQYTYTFTGWDKPFAAVTGLATYKASFSSQVNKYTVEWKNEDGTTLEKDENVAYGTTPSYDGATPTKEATAEYTYTFNGWTPVILSVTGDITYTATFKSNPIAAVEDLEIGITDVVTLTEPTIKDNLILTSNGTVSGQLIGAEYLTLTGDAYFEYAVNAEASKWYQIAVPWEVNVLDGISVNGHIVQQNKLAIIYYDGYRRSIEGPNKCWKNVADDGNVMRPGRLYLIALAFDAPVIRFKASDPTHLLTTNTEVSAYKESTDNGDKDSGWNGVANPALFNAFVNAGATIGQVYNPNGSYSTINLNTTKLIVGQGAFVQVPANKSVVVQYGAPFAAAPRRNSLGDDENINYEVRIAPVNKDYTDCVFIQANADKDENRYTIGKDLIKMGVSSSVPQMWINRYDVKLCLNTMAHDAETVDYPLNIFAPKNGEYVLSAIQEYGDAILYLTYDNQVVWNLSYGAFIANLPAGTDNNYGLRIVAKAPQIATDIDEAIVDSKDATATKVLINGQVFIIRGKNVYSIDGRLVK